MSFEQVWPVQLLPQECGSVLVSFPSVPEALTEGTSEHDALEQALDCLVAALGGYVSDRRTIPPPLPSLPERTTISLPAHIAAKLTLYRAMHALDVSITELGDQLSVSKDYVRRLIDLDHNSHIGQIETALHMLK